MEENESKRETKEEREARRIHERMAQVFKIRGVAEETEIMGYCYRKTWNGKPSTLPPVDGFIDDHEMGLLYGPGQYVVNYFRADNNAEVGVLRYNIGMEYAQLHRDACLQEGRPCFLDSMASISGHKPPPGSQLMDLLSEDKLKGVAAFLGTMKMIMAPAAPAPDNSQNMLMVEMFKAMAQPRQNTSDAIAAEALKMLAGPREQQNPAKMLRDQIDMFRDLQTITNPAAAAAREDSEREENMSPMERMIGKALDALPTLLEKFGGNVEQAAQAAKKANPMETFALKQSPALQRDFYGACVKRYGKDMADRWARSYGLEPAKLGAQDVTPQATKPAAQQSQPGRVNFK